MGQESTTIVNLAWGIKMMCKFQENWQFKIKLLVFVEETIVQQGQSIMNGIYGEVVALEFLSIQPK